MKIIEQYVAGKHDAQTCEDGIAVTDHFAAVIDGSTSKSPLHLHPDMANGRFAMQLLARLVHEIPADISLNQFCIQATQLFHNQYNTLYSNVPMPPHQRLCASMVMLSTVHRELWMIGDCQCMVDGTLYENGKPAEATLAAHRAALFDRCVQAHPDMIVDGQLVHDYARDAILPQLIESMAAQNIGYAVIDGYPVYMDGVKTIALPDHATEIVMATDGYPFLRPTLASSEAALRQQMRDDPFNISSFVATKGLMQGNGSFDDRAYLRLMLEAKH